jgi:hypothetical protein
MNSQFQTAGNSGMKNRLLEYDRTREEHVGARTSPGKKATGAFSGWVENLEAVIANYPAVSLVAALTAGVMLGWLVKRK